MTTKNMEFCIKLLAGNNVVSVEANNFESEIFVPQIVNGRITLLNIIPNRRCCQGKGVKIVMKSEVTNSNSASHENILRPMRPPLANSTPAKAIKNYTASMRTNARINSISANNYCENSEPSLPTPEICRRVMPARPNLNEDVLKSLPPGIKVMRLFHNSNDGTPSKVGRLVTSANNASITREDFHNMTNISCSFRLPSTPSASHSNGAVMASSTPLKSRAAPSISKWQCKVLTPAKTYSKRGGCAKTKHSLSSAKKGMEPLRVLPSYRVNPTKGPQPTHTIEVRKRRLVLDTKVKISSRSLKRQLKQECSTSRHKSILGTSISFTSLQKRRRLPMSAFDLLTTSNHSHCISTKLQEQFRERCINKASSTYSKYKLLCSIPPIIEDAQVLELTQQIMEQNSSQSAEQINNESNSYSEVTSNTPIIAGAPIVLNFNQAGKVHPQPSPRVSLIGNDATRYVLK